MNISFKSILVLLFACLSVQVATAQSQVPKNWFLQDPKTSGFPGVNVEKAYAELLKNLTPDTVIVAVIDSGTDYVHEDLRAKMWRNPREISSNGVDDDKNGYVDDVFGWSFIGGKNGNVNKDTYEVTRLYKAMLDKFQGIDTTKLNKKQQKDFALLKLYRAEVDSILKQSKQQLAAIDTRQNAIFASLDSLTAQLRGEAFSRDWLDSLNTEGRPVLQMGKMMVTNAMNSGLSIESPDELKELVEAQFAGARAYFGDRITYSYNVDFDPRDIVGDVPSNLKERYYGNANAKGPDSSHGTHVAGIIGAERNNGIGIDGVAEPVKLMAVRAVPDGDERDKDVANAIRYAVDNGAKVINMSFGKAFSPHKKIVDDAVRYAMKHDVLLIHAAGNSSQNIDQTGNYPNPYFEKKRWFGAKRANNYVTVGAVGPTMNENMVARFSNYGAKTVDVFAPGHQIFSTMPENEYANNSGTSMAAPMVAGVAALIRAYYPTLTAAQTREIIMNSVLKIDTQVKQPGSGTLVNFNELCSTGGIVDAYAALELASKTKGKKKIKK